MGAPISVATSSKLADTCNQYLTKGKQVYVEGRLSSRTYQTQDQCTQSAYRFNLVS